MKTKLILTLVGLLILGAIFIEYSTTTDYYCRFEEPAKCEQSSREVAATDKKAQAIEARLGRKLSHDEWFDLHNGKRFPTSN